ncbi:8258_t:CDS:2 [Funneliformis mosseae]|uniref:8258_t:CDS:1 n=1 Tax=Funneliformis mosseae TaxID=27381 RepID=A0A9N9F0G9_FUNMO|nr:8258_t:CDS:2 [Funneliformis mosseae]
MSQLIPTLKPFAKTSATGQKSIVADNLPPVVRQRHKSVMIKKRTIKQQVSDDDDGNKNEPEAYRPYTATNIKIKRTKYSTSLDSRGYIPVYEFIINDQPIMWDRENGYVHFTGIWKALGNNKADIARLVDTHPDLASTIKKVRGGFLKIQGTWMPHEKAYELCRRTCYVVREELVPLFGPSFPSQTLDPTQPGFGRLTLTDSVPTKKRQRRKPKDTRVDNISITNNIKDKGMKASRIISSPIEENGGENTNNVKCEIHDDFSSVDQSLQFSKFQSVESNRHLVILRKQKRTAEDLHFVENMLENQLLSKRRRHQSPENGSLGDDENSSSECDPDKSLVIDRRGSDSAYSSSSQHYDVKHQYSPTEAADLMSKTRHNGISHSFKSSNITTTHSHPQIDPYTPYPPPTVHPTSPYQTPPSPLTEHDLYDAISATVALQQLSQDNGTRPLQKDQARNAWPRNFIMGNREFQFVGCRYRVVRYW